ncbi:hypothetical protein BCR44DRAFT_1070774 [Catenaria anguillulae PL171]|uniref:Uncharacterized protein n=1 Tax=Catenaria anguillulae PL171 TaxID=765915 RepID=A0A1Y2H745_9FUNG|nr:hypothetical protein BCR44DRAFT_1070774 [Catenaria anguillulae PL171]
MLSLAPRRSPAVSRIVDRGLQASVYLDLKHFGEDAKLALPTADEVRSSKGAAAVKINGKLERFWLPSPVWLKNVKVSRKEKYIEFIVTKQLHAFAPKSGLLGLPFHQSVHDVHKIASPKDFSQVDLGQMLGIMFSDDEIQVKRNSMPRNFASRALSLAFDLKESVQILFIRAFEGHKFVMLQDHQRGGFGIILINQVLLFPPTRTSKGWTPALDIVYSVVPPAPESAETRAFEARYMDAMEEVLRKHMFDNAPILKIDGDEVQAICDLLNLAHLCCGNKDLPNPMPGRMPIVSCAAKQYLKRGILTPLYPADGLERSKTAKKMVEGASKGVGGAVNKERAYADAQRKAQAMMREMMASGKDPLTLARELGIDLSQLQLS